MTLFNIQENVPMRKYLSLRCGGNARYFAEINNVNELQEAQKFALSKGIPTFLPLSNSSIKSFIPSKPL